MKWRRLFLSLIVALTLVGMSCWYWVLHTEAGARWVWAQVEAAGVGMVTAGGIEGSLGAGVTIRSLVIDTGESELLIDSVHLRADVDLLPPQVEISDIEVAAEAVGITGNLDVGLTGANDIALDARAALMPELTGLRDDVRLDITATGDLTDLTIRVAADAPQASLTGSVSDVLDEPGFELTMAVATVDTIQIPNMRFGDVRASVQGSVTAYEVTASGTIEHPSTGAIRVDVEGRGDLGSFDARALSARSEVGSGSGSATVRWSDGLNALGSIGITDLDLHHWVERWPAANTISGSVSFEVDPDRLDVEGGRLDVRGTDMWVDLDATVDLVAQTVAGELGWRGLQLPVGDPAPSVLSRTGRITLAGTLDDWTVQGDIGVGTPAVPSGRFSIDGGGDRDSVAVRIVDADLLGGSIEGEAAYRWRDGRPWSATLDVDDIEIAGVDARWPAVLDGRVEFSGQREPFALSATFADVRGELEGESFAGDGQFSISDDELSARALSLQHGGSSVFLDGSVYGDGIRYELVVDELGDYVDEASGAVDAIGSVSLNDERPFLRVDATSESLTYGDLAVGGLVVSDHGSPDSVLDIELSAAMVSSAEQSVESLRIRPVIREDEQSLAIDASLGELSARLEVSGAADDWRDPALWQGQLESLELSFRDIVASIPEPTAVRASRSDAKIERLCLREELVIVLCAALSWEAEERLTLDAELVSMPVDAVNLLMDTRLAFDQIVSGHFSWERTPGGASGESELTITPGTITSVDRPELAVRTDRGTLGFDIVGDDIRAGIVDLPMPGFGRIAAEFAVDDPTLGDESDIDGRLDVDLSDIQLFAALIPVIDQAGGSLKAGLTLDGSVMAPNAFGDVLINDGRLTYLPLGLRLEEIELSTLIHGLDRFEVAGSFRAGEGRATIDTRADYSEAGASGLHVRLRGNNLRVIDVPDVRAVADTDIDITFVDQTLGLDGRIIFQRVRITPRNIGFSRVEESEDVIIVAGELPEAAVEESSEAQLKINGTLGIALGRDVVVDLGVASANVTGSALFTWSGDPMPVVDGRYDVEGEILAFNQKLEVVSGGLRFPNVPADDPQIRLRAVRQIYGNSQIKEAGVIVSGNIRRPTVEAYTNPLTTEQRALTLLLTGSEFNYEQGVGAVNVGTYIAPKIYASYGVGLFERENVIRVRYDLARGFGITATSGEREGGLDLSYRFEN